MRHFPLVVFALLAALALSQVPTFVQEYEQRLGGAIDELARVIARDADNARALGLDLNAFLQKHELSGDPAFHKTGQAMRERLSRHRDLTAAAKTLDAAPVWRKPFLLAADADRDIAQRAWEKFRPTLTLDPLFGSAGLLIALLIRDLAAWLWGLVFGRRKRRLPR